MSYHAVREAGWWWWWWPLIDLPATEVRGGRARVSLQGWLHAPSVLPRVKILPFRMAGKRLVYVKSVVYQT